MVLGAYEVFFGPCNQEIVSFAATVESLNPFKKASSKDLGTYGSHMSVPILGAHTCRFQLVKGLNRVWAL